MVVNKKDRTREHGRKEYSEQSDQSLPLFVITGLDNEFSPQDPIQLQMLHFKNYGRAIEFSHKYAEQLGWKKWEVFCNSDKRLIYKRNMHIKEEWSILNAKDGD